MCKDSLSPTLPICTLQMGRLSRCFWAGDYISSRKITALKSCILEMDHTPLPVNTCPCQKPITTLCEESTPVIMLGSLDTPTIFFFVSTTYIMQAIIMVGLFRIARRYRGVTMWLLCMVLIAVGFVLLALRMVAPAWLSIVLANTIITVAAAALARGSELFLEVPTRRSMRLAIPLIALVLVSFSIFTYAYPSLNARAVVILSVISYFTGYAAWVFWRHAPADLQPSATVIVGVLTLSTLAMVVSAVARTVVPVVDVFQKIWLQQFIFLLPFFTGIAWTAGVAALIIQRTMRDVRLSAQIAHQVQLAEVLSDAYQQTIEGWAQALDLRDKETAGHSQRVTEMTVWLARELGVAENELANIRRGAILHDVGKLGVPDEVLLKPDPLNDKERHLMQQHPVYAYQWLSAIEFLRPALDIPYCHHERWDGRGYPRGLQGEAIPFAARIFAVVDAWDAMTNDRPYRAALNPEEARRRLHEAAGTQFDPFIVEIFLERQPLLSELVQHEVLLNPPLTLPDPVLPT